MDSENVWWICVFAFIVAVIIALGIKYLLEELGNKVNAQSRVQQAEARARTEEAKAARADAKAREAEANARIAEANSKQAEAEFDKTFLGKGNV